VTAGTLFSEKDISANISAVTAEICIMTDRRTDCKETHMPVEMLEKTRKQLDEKYGNLRTLMEEYLILRLGFEYGFGIGKARPIAEDAANITLLDMVQENLPHAIGSYEQENG